MGNLKQEPGSPSTPGANPRDHRGEKE